MSRCFEYELHISFSTQLSADRDMSKRDQMTASSRASQVKTWWEIFIGPEPTFKFEVLKTQFSQISYRSSSFWTQSRNLHLPSSHIRIRIHWEWETCMETIRLEEDFLPIPSHPRSLTLDHLLSEKHTCIHVKLLRILRLFVTIVSLSLWI